MWNGNFLAYIAVENCFYLLLFYQVNNNILAGVLHVLYAHKEISVQC